MCLMGHCYVFAPHWVLKDAACSRPAEWSPWPKMRALSWRKPREHSCPSLLRRLIRLCRTIQDCVDFLVNIRGMAYLGACEAGPHIFTPQIPLRIHRGASGLFLPH